jgi:DNA-binding NarL/FixJ family response regulator
MATPPKMQNARKPHRVFLVEDHPVTRQGFALLLNRETDMTVCGEAATAAKALSDIESLKPDLVIVDIALPGRDGLELIKNIVTFHPRLPTLVLSTLDEMVYAKRALQAGAKGYAMKHEPVEQLLMAVRQVLAGEVYLSEAMRKNLLVNSLHASSQNPVPGVDGLTDREVEVFRLIGEGLGTRYIAERLGLSISTVESHRTHIKEKLGLKSAPDLVRQAVEWLHGQNFKH